MTLESSTTVETTTPPATEAPASSAPATAAADQPKPDSAGLSAGFNKVRGGDAHTESRPAKPEVEETQTPSAAQAAPTEADAGKVEKPTVLAGMTEDEVKAALGKAARVDEVEQNFKNFTAKVHGTLGQMQQALKALQTAPAASGQPVKVAKDALKKLREAGFDEIADLLVQDLDGLLVAAPATFDATSLEKALTEKFETRLTEANKAAEKKILTIRHSDWPQVYASPEFKEWGKTLPDGVFTQLVNSWDSELISDALTDFKQWRDDRKKAAADAQVKADATKREKDKRLEKAIPPSKGAADNTPTRLPDKAGLGRGFARVRGTG